MIDGRLDKAESAVRQVAALHPGESYSRSEFIPAFHVTPDRIRRAKRGMVQTLSAVIARAQKVSFGHYHTHTIHSHTRNYDVIVVAIVVREFERDLAFN